MVRMSLFAPPAGALAPLGCSLNVGAPPAAVCRIPRFASTMIPRSSVTGGRFFKYCFTPFCPCANAGKVSTYRCMVASEWGLRGARGRVSRAPHSEAQSPRADRPRAPLGRGWPEHERADLRLLRRDQQDAERDRGNDGVGLPAVAAVVAVVLFHG